MGGARETPDATSAQRDDALVEGRRKAVGGSGRTAAGPPGLLALQRSAGNAAVSALLAGRMRSPGAAAVGDIDAALREVRRDEPVIETVEKGLQAAKTAGVPVDLDGAAQKPPASALAVVRTGFGPESVPAPKPVAPRNRYPRSARCGQGGCTGQAEHGWGHRRCPEERTGVRRSCGVPRRARRRGFCGGRHDTGRVVARQVARASGAPARCPAGGRSGVHPRHQRGERRCGGETGTPACGVEGEGGPGRGTPSGRRPGRAGQGRQGRHDGRPAARGVRQDKHSSPR